MTYFRNIAIDTNAVSGDAFGRLRVSSPENAHDCSFQYDLQPLVYEAVTVGTGAAVAHDATNRCATLSFTATTTGGTAVMQSYDWMRYQPGRSQLIFTTFNFIAPAANVLKFVGYSDGANGVELQQNGTAGVRLALYSDTDKGDEFVNQAAWSIDPLDGTGPSGIVVDWTKTHIFVISAQWLGVGRIVCGLDIDGVVIPVHAFNHANIQTVPYMQHFNLPVRAGMTNTGTATTSMRFICASVISEGGQVDPPGFTFAVEGAGTAGNNARAHILSVRPKTLFNSIANRSRFVLDQVDVLVTGNTPVYWELVLGQAITGANTFVDVSTAHSAVEYNTGGTISGSPTLVIAAGYVAASAQTKTTISRSLSARYPITLNAAGAVRSMGTLSLIATGLGATSATRAALSWRGVR